MGWPGESTGAGALGLRRFGVEALARALTTAGAASSRVPVLVLESGAMSNPFRDQLQKANLLSKKDAKRLAHEERVHRTEAGRAGVEEEQRARQDELDRLRTQDREQQRAQQAQTDAERRVVEERAACENILRQEVTRPGQGRLRFYFQVESGDLPWLEFSEIDHKRMLSGEFAVVRSGSAQTHDYGLLALAAAKRVARHFPERVAWWPPAAGQARA